MGVSEAEWLLLTPLGDETLQLSLQTGRAQAIRDGGI
jgi:hypothetical protein